MSDCLHLSEESFNPDNSLCPIKGPTLDDFDNRLLIGRERCPVCESLFVTPFRYIFDSQTLCRYLLRVCLDCRSAWNAPTLLDPISRSKFKHPEFDVHAHLDKMERNFSLAEIFFDKIAPKGPFASVLEVGCGIGSTLKVAADRGMKVCGYDINATSIAKGKELFKLPLFSDEWTSKTVPEKYDLVLCILVLEHLIWPLSLINELAVYGQRTGAVLFISVPRFLRIYWSHVLDADPRNEGNMLRSARGHFTHFSEEGLEGAFRKYGCEVYPFSNKNSWGGILCDFRKS